MSRSYPFPRLSLMRAIDRPGSPTAALPPDVFARLQALAQPKATIDVSELPDGDDLRAGPMLPQRTVRCGRSLLFRCSLPQDWAEGQALLLERDAAGMVTLLSHPALLDAAVWYRRTVEVPRMDAMPDGSGATGTVHLLAPGRSELLVVCCRDPAIGFDRLALFRRLLDERAIGPLSFPAIGADDLTQLATMLERTAPEDRAIVAGNIEVVPDGIGIEPDFQWLSASPHPHPSPSSDRPQQDRPVRDAANQNVHISTRQEATNMPNEPIPAPAQTIEPIPEDIREMLAQQTKLVREWAAAANDGSGKALRYYRRKDAILNSLERRLADVVDAGLFVDINNQRPSRADIVAMQSWIAHKIHGLRYALAGPMPDDPNKKPPAGRWVTEAEFIKPGGRRSDTYIDNYMNYAPTTRNTIPKVDVALIAHCFQLPIEVWELANEERFRYWVQQAQEGRDLFRFAGLSSPDHALSFRLPIEVWEITEERRRQYWVQQAKEGRDLFRFAGLHGPDHSVSFLLPMAVWELTDEQQVQYWVQQAKEDRDLFNFGGLARQDNALRIIDLGHKDAPPPPPQAKVADGQKRARPAIMAEHLIRFEMDLPDHFTSAQVFLFEDDGSQITLISTPAQTDDDVIYHGTFQSPRVLADPEKAPLPAVWFAPNPPTTSFLTLLVKPDATLKLNELELYQGEQEKSYRVMTYNQIDELHRQLLALPPEQWLLLRKNVTIESGAGDKKDVSADKASP